LTRNHGFSVNVSWIFITDNKTGGAEGGASRALGNGIILYNKLQQTSLIAVVHNSTVWPTSRGWGNMMSSSTMRQQELSSSWDRRPWPQ